MNKTAFSLNSTVFRDTKFLIWLKKQSNFSIIILIIVLLETYHWFKLRNISESVFNKLISSLEAVVIHPSKDQMGHISDNAIKSGYQFKNNIRDIIIATLSEMREAVVITHNKNHFDWMVLKPMTPDEFVMSLVD